MGNIESLDMLELEGPQETPASLLDRADLGIIKDVKIKIEVRIGEAELSVGELFALGKDSVVALSRSIDEPIDLLLDGKVIGRGHLVAADDNFGIQVVEVG